MPDFQIVKNKAVYLEFTASKSAAQKKIKEVSYLHNGASYHLYIVNADGRTSYLGTWLSGRPKGKRK